MRNKLIIISFILIILGGFYLKYSNNDKLIAADYNPKYKINELYTSKEVYYRKMLNDDEKKIYEKIIEGIIDFKPNISIELSMDNFQVQVDYLQKIADAVMLDHPELFYYGYPSYVGTKNGKVININFNYLITKSEYNTNLNKIKKIIEEVKNKTDGMNEYDKIKYIYEYLGERNNYGKINTVEGQTALSAFLMDLSPVCAGYSKASEILFNNVGIKSLLIRGDLKNTLFTGDAHMWNLVKVGKYYYIYDVTQSSTTKSISGNISYMGLLSGKRSDYTFYYKKVIPMIKNDLDYYKLNNLIYTYKNNNIEELNKMLNVNNKYVEIRVKNVETLRLDFNKIKKDTSIKTFWQFNDIILFEKR